MAFAASIPFPLLTAQLSSTVPEDIHLNVNFVVEYSYHIDISEEPRTAIVQSCNEDREMALPSEQKKTISNLYKIGAKITRFESHSTFLNKCLEFRVIPTSFKVQVYQETKFQIKLSWMMLVLKA